MIGKKNIVFGFFYLVLTAALGPVLVLFYLEDMATAEAAKQEKLGFLQQAQASGFEVELEPMKLQDIAKANTAAILALSNRINARATIEAISANPHAHGNLEALLNIAVGVVLVFLAVPTVFKQIISWTFIAGALLHSGLLYLGIALPWEWARGLLESWFGYIGPSLILIGLFLIGVAAVRGFKAETVRDRT